jgi:HK97 family phage portal protein
MSILTKAISSLTGYWQSGPAKLTDPILPRMFGAASSYAGRSVTVDGALTLSAVNAAVTLIAGNIAGLPCMVYWNRQDGRAPARTHPLWTLLKDAPNADMTAFEFFETTAAHLLLWGDSFAKIDRTPPLNGVAGRVVSLTPIHPAHMTVRRADDGSIEYLWNDGLRRPERIPEDECLHIKGFATDGLRGLSPIAMARQSLGLAMAAEEAAGGFFANGMRSSGYVTAATMTKDLRTEAEAYLERFRGAANTGKTPLLPAGWDWHAFSMNPAEAQLLSTRQFSVEEVARWFRIPPHMLGHMTPSSSYGTGLEQQMLGFLTLCLRPWLKRIEQSLKRKLLAPGERGALEIEFNASALMRADSAGRAAYYVSMVQNGLMTRDEVRDLENLTRRGGGADALTVQAQNVNIDLAGTAPAPAAPTAPTPAVPTAKTEA